MADITSILEATTSSEDTTRRAAESHIQDLYQNPDFAPQLCTVAANGQYPQPIRQSALLVLKNLVLAGWSDSFDEFGGEILVDGQRSEYELEFEHERERVGCTQSS